MSLRLTWGDMTNRFFGGSVRSLTTCAGGSPRVLTYADG